MLSTIFHNSWQSGCVNLIDSPDIADRENRRKTLSTARGRGPGGCQPDISTKYRLGCELSYGTCTCPISLCAL